METRQASSHLIKSRVDKSSSDFPEFNGLTHKWTQLKQTYSSVAANHGIGRILGNSPVPDENSKDRELFIVQNQYFYNIFKVKIKSGKAKVIVNQHAQNLDGKNVWRKFCERYEHFSIVTMNKETYFAQLTSMPLNDGYKGGPLKFLNDFRNLISEMQTSTNEIVKDSDLVGFLTAAISDSAAFRPIKASLDTNALMNKQEGMLQVLKETGKYHKNQ